MILVWGVADDPPTAAVLSALAARSASYALVDQRNVLQTAIELRVDGDVAGSVRLGAERVPLEEVTAVYVRPFDSRRVPHVRIAGEGSAQFVHALSVDEALLTFSEVSPALVVNPPSRMASNGSKPFQAALVRAAGFDIPDTLVTTDAAAARDFWERHGEVVYKSVSGARSIVSRLHAGHLPRLADVAWCPTQFQEYVHGRELRVHVVGEDVFACEIESDADDYRYAAQQGADVELRAVDLPDECAHRCRALAGRLELPLAGIDLRRTDDGRWFCFEVNPSPGFTYYEAATGQPIAAAIGRLLAEAG